MSIKNHIPNTITCMSLVCGVLGIVFTFHDRFDWALYSLFCGAFFDFIDGLAARGLKASSPIGKELDSISDCITFGVLPAVMLFRYISIARGGDWWCYIPLLLPVFSALRLAKFNIDERQTNDFLGLATPASALLCASLAHFLVISPHSFLTAWASGRVLIPLIVVILCALMVCELPMFSFKLKKSNPREPLFILKIIFALAVFVSLIVILALRLKYSIVIFLAVIVYILINIVYYFIAKPSSR